MVLAAAVMGEALMVLVAVADIQVVVILLTGIIQTMDLSTNRDTAAAAADHMSQMALSRGGYIKGMGNSF